MGWCFGVFGAYPNTSKYCKLYPHDSPRFQTTGFNKKHHLFIHSFSSGEGVPPKRSFPLQKIAILHIHDGGEEVGRVGDATDITICCPKAGDMDPQNRY